MIEILCGEIWFQRCYKYGLWITVSGICEDVSSRTGQMADFPVDQRICLYYSLKTVSESFKCLFPGTEVLCQALRMLSLESDTGFLELLCRLPHLDGLGLHSCRKQKPHSNNNEIEPIYATTPFFKVYTFLSFYIYFPVETFISDNKNSTICWFHEYKIKFIYFGYRITLYFYTMWPL